MITAKDLFLRTPQSQIVAGPFNFSIQKKIALLKGANGSGKSSLFKSIVGNQIRQEGLFQTDFDIKFSYLSQFYLDDFNLPYSIGQILNAFDIAEDKMYMSRGLSQNLIWRSCSGGEKQRVLIDIALNQDCNILLLDEPLNNLDHSSKTRFWKVLNEVLNTNLKLKHLLLTSHEVPTDLDYDEVFV